MLPLIISGKNSERQQKPYGANRNDRVLGMSCPATPERQLRAYAEERWSLYFFCKTREAGAAARDAAHTIDI